MTIFDYLKNIAVTKQELETFEEYVPFLTSRWLSFTNPTVCQFINNFNNKTCLEDKETHYKILLACFPKLKYLPKIKYIKKVKEDLPPKQEQFVKAIAANLELSEREVLFLLRESSAY